jgi:hypothetical protein
MLKYIDLLLQMVLVVFSRRWNEGWEDWFGHSKDYFDFVTLRL